MANGSQKRDNWQECPPGTLQGYARRHNRNRQIHGLARAASAAAAVLAFAGLTWWSVDRWAGEREYHFGGIACSEVQSNFEAYVMGSLPAETSERIRVHLSECPACQEMMRRMQPPAAPSAMLRPAVSARVTGELVRQSATMRGSAGGAVQPEMASAAAYSIAQAP